MRISDWSSDVCSSDLARIHITPSAKQHFASISRRFSSITVAAPVRVTGSARPSALVRSSPLMKIGRASCRERVCQYVSISVVAVSLKKKKKKATYKRHKDETILRHIMYNITTV